MQKPREMVPGGPTDRVAKAGGQELYVALQQELAGHSVEQIVYALTHSSFSVAFFALESEDEAAALLQRMADDAINQIRLNWPDRRRLIADAIASWHGKGGRG